MYATRQRMRRTPSLRASWKSKPSLMVDGDANCEDPVVLPASAKSPDALAGWGAGTEMGANRSKVRLTRFGLPVRPASVLLSTCSLGAGRASRLPDDAGDAALLLLGLLLGLGEVCSSLSFSLSMAARR
jgi:hypothetical protein